MNILAIDTITPALSVSASGSEGTVTLSVTNGGQHAVKLVQTIETVLDRAGIKASEIDIVAVPEGPGSFTGLRLSWASAKAIALAANCRLVPIPTLDMYAYRFSQWNGPVISVLDAKKSRFYARVYRNGKPASDSLDIEADELSAYVKTDENLLVTGPDASLFSEKLRLSLPLQRFVGVVFGETGASHELLFLALASIEDYTERAPDHIGPLYVRRSDAEIESREKKPD